MTRSVRDADVADEALELIISYDALGDPGVIAQIARDLEDRGPGIRGPDFHRRLIVELRRRADMTWEPRAP
jgi:hypothetical protein